MIIVGGTAGSGTRLLAIMCIKAGYDMGKDVNESFDALLMSSFFTRWTYKYLSEGESDEMRKELVSCVEKYKSLTKGKWGFKEPQTIYFLPLLHTIFPDMKFLHLVRNGKTMAFSNNNRHVRHYGSLYAPNLKGPHQAIKMWNDANIMAYNYGKKYMGKNYLMIRFEDLCSNRRPTYVALAKFLNFPIKDIKRLSRKADSKKTTSVARMKKQDKLLLAELEKIGKRDW